MKKLIFAVLILGFIGYAMSKPVNMKSGGECKTNSRGELTCDHATSIGSNTTRTQLKCRTRQDTGETKCTTETTSN